MVGRLVLYRSGVGTGPAHVGPIFIPARFKILVELRVRGRNILIVSDQSIIASLAPEYILPRCPPSLPP